MAIFSKLTRSAEGARVPHHKETDQMTTEKCPVPAKVYLPMQQHIGAPATPVVNKGDRVYVGSLVGKAGGFVSADVHSGVSGTVAGIEELQFPNGARVAAVVIDTDGEQEVLPGLSAPTVTDYDSFVEAVRSAGLVGLGGAGFPTAVKLAPKDLNALNTLVINGAECEPYITADNREFLECTDHVLNGIALVKKYLGINRVIVAIEDNKKEAIDLMSARVKEMEGVEVKALPARYPQGAEKVLIEKTTGREVPQGGLPADVGVLVMNVTTISTISKYLETGMPLTTKRLTVDGDAVAQPKNVEVIIGTPIKDVIEFCGGYKGEVAKLISGGPMMGTALQSDAFPVIKQNNAILCFGPAMAAVPKAEPCIRCGRCISACPMGLSPVEIAGAFTKRDKEGLDTLKVDLCMECGCCAYVCPAKRPVTQTMRLAKAFQKTGGKK